MTFGATVLLALVQAIGTFGSVLYAPPAPHEKHALDVYAPVAAHKRPVVVFFHGGGLQEGDRKNYAFFGRALARQGFVVVVPSYRLYPATRVRGTVADSATAVAWTANNIARFGGSPRNIVLVGHSAGGYLAAILVFDRRYLRDAGLRVSPIRGVFELSADYSNRDPDPGESARDLAIDHHIYGESAEERDANSVYRYLRKTIPFEATCETIDPGTQCIDRDHFVALMRGYGSPVKAFTEANATHDQLVARATSIGDPLNRELKSFIARVTMLH